MADSLLHLFVTDHAAIDCLYRAVKLQERNLSLVAPEIAANVRCSLLKLFVRQEHSHWNR